VVQRPRSTAQIHDRRASAIRRTPQRPPHPAGPLPDRKANQAARPRRQNARESQRTSQAPPVPRHNRRLLRAARPAPRNRQRRLRGPDAAPRRQAADRRVPRRALHLRQLAPAQEQPQEPVRAPPGGLPAGGVRGPGGPLLSGWTPAAGLHGLDRCVWAHLRGYPDPCAGARVCQRAGAARGRGFGV